MQQVKNGDSVKVHYHGTLNDGQTFDSSQGREPLEFTVGQGLVIHGFDKALLDMKVGDKKMVNIPALEAYGPVNQDMFITVPKEQVPPDMTPELGMEVHLTDENGESLPAIVVKIEDNAIVLDANHPLAGHDLNFDIELVAIGS